MSTKTVTGTFTFAGNSSGTVTLSDYIGYPDSISSWVVTCAQSITADIDFRVVIDNVGEFEIGSANFSNAKTAYGPITGSGIIGEGYFPLLCNKNKLKLYVSTSSSTSRTITISITYTQNAHEGFCHEVIGQVYYENISDNKCAFIFDRRIVGSTGFLHGYAFEAGLYVTGDTHNLYACDTASETSSSNLIGYYETDEYAILSFVPNEHFAERANGRDTFVIDFGSGRIVGDGSIIFILYYYTNSVYPIGYHNGTGYTNCSVKYYDGTQFVNCKPYYYNGTSWVLCSQYWPVCR